MDKISTPPANSKVVQLKTRGMTQKNPKMQTLRSLNPMMKLDHVMVNNRIYLTDMICQKLQSILISTVFAAKGSQMQRNTILLFPSGIFELHHNSNSIERISQMDKYA